MPVLICIGIGELQNQTAHGRFLIIGCHVCTVFGNEDVRRDAAAAIYGASDACVIGWAGVLYAVLREELSVLEPGKQVLVVLQFVARSVRLLNTSARRSVISRYGESYHASVGEVNLLLYKSFAERAPADDGASVVVLYRPGKDFGCRSGCLIDENHERDVLI